MNTGPDDELANDHGASDTRRAILVTVVAQFFSKLGDTFANAKTVLPWLLQAVGAPAFMVPLLVPIRESGSLIPQVFFSRIVDRQVLKKYVWSLACVLQGLCVALIGVVTFLWQGNRAGWLILALLVVFSLSRCLASISAKLVLAKTISKDRRGSTTGLSASAAGAIAVVFGSAIALGWVSMSSQQADLRVLGLCLFAAGGCWLMSAAIFASIDEARDEHRAEGSESQADQQSLWSYFRPLFGEPVFVRYLVARILFLTTAMSAPYYVLLSSKSGVGSVQALGLFILASGLAGLLSGSVWGRFADTSSKRVWIVAALGASLTGLVVSGLSALDVQIATQLWFVPLFYFLLEACHQGVRVGRKTFVVNASSSESRAAYVTASNTIIGVMLLLLGGVAAFFQNISPDVMIAAFSVLCLLGCLVAAGLPEVEKLAEDADPELSCSRESH